MAVANRLPTLAPLQRVGSPSLEKMMIKLELTIDEINGILVALNKAPIPAELSVPLMDKIKAQAVPQLPQEPPPQQEIPLEEAK